MRGEATGRWYLVEHYRRDHRASPGCCSRATTTRTSNGSAAGCSPVAPSCPAIKARQTSLARSSCQSGTATDKETESTMSGRIEGKVAIVTGGASGIGAGTVTRFVEEGARVVVADLQVDAGKRLAAELGERSAVRRDRRRRRGRRRGSGRSRRRRVRPSRRACSTTPASSGAVGPIAEPTRRGLGPHQSPSCSARCSSA